MNKEEFRQKLDEILNPPRNANTVFNELKGAKVRCSWCDTEHEIDRSVKGAINLLVSFVDCRGGSDKKHLLSSLDRINYACRHVPTRGAIDSELMGQTELVLSLLAEQCSDFDEFVSILNSCDYRINSSRRAVGIGVGSLIKLGSRKE